MKALLLSIALLVFAGVATAGTPVLDGTLDAAAGYIPMPAAVVPPAAFGGFGPLIDASALWFTEDGGNIYLFVQCARDPGTDNGVMVLLGTSGEVGLPPGLPGVGAAAGGHAFDGGPPGVNVAYSFDFEVDHAWVGNSGFTPVDWWIDNVNMVGGRVPGFTGNSGTVGAPLGPGSLGETHAFNAMAMSGGPGISTGWEIGIPRASLGGIGPGAMIQAFAVVVSSTAFFSDDAVPPGPAGNPGFNVMYPGLLGPQVATIFGAVPVELSKFMID